MASQQSSVRASPLCSRFAPAREIPTIGEAFLDQDRYPTSGISAVMFFNVIADLRKVVGGWFRPGETSAGIPAIDQLLYVLVVDKLALIRGGNPLLYLQKKQFIVIDPSFRSFGHQGLLSRPCSDASRANFLAIRVSNSLPTAYELRSFVSTPSS